MTAGIRKNLQAEVYIDLMVSIYPRDAFLANPAQCAESAKLLFHYSLFGCGTI
jgi:hypothetical protein